MDDTLIKERKAGLNAYLKDVLQENQLQVHPALVEFLTPASAGAVRKFNLEDALPSTLSRKDAEAIMAASGLTVAAYYPDWSVNSNPPERIDYSKFDLIHFGDRNENHKIGTFQLISFNCETSFCDTGSSVGLSWDVCGEAILQRLVGSGCHLAY